MLWRASAPEATARAPSSGENFFVVLFVIALSSQALGPPTNPVRFSSSVDVGTAGDAGFLGSAVDMALPSSSPHTLDRQQTAILAA